MVFPRPTNVAAGQPDHAPEHNQINDHLNQLNNRLVLTTSRVEDLLQVAADSLPSHNTTAITGAEVDLRNVNRWTVAAPVTLNLPSRPDGAQYLVHVASGFQNITWPNGTEIFGETAADESWLTLVRGAGQWVVLIPSPEIQIPDVDTIPIYDQTHPLFAAGLGNGSNVADFNDFFGTAHTSIHQATGYYLYRYRTASGVSGGGSYGVAWADQAAVGGVKFRWGTLEALITSVSRNALLPADGSTGKVVYPLAGASPNSGVTPYINTSFLAFLPPTDFRNAFTTAGSVPTAVVDPASLSSWAAGTAPVPVGASIFVVSIGKPVWKKEAGTFVDATGATVFPVA